VRTFDTVEELRQALLGSPLVGAGAEVTAMNPPAPVTRTFFTRYRMICATTDGIRNTANLRRPATCSGGGIQIDTRQCPLCIAFRVQSTWKPAPTHGLPRARVCPLVKTPKIDYDRCCMMLTAVGTTTRCDGLVTRAMS
jgi:hypothetical protein